MKIFISLHSKDYKVIAKVRKALVAKGLRDDVTWNRSMAKRKPTYLDIEPHPTSLVSLFTKDYNVENCERYDLDKEPFLTEILLG